MPTPTFTETGNKATTPAKLDKAVFGVEVKNHELLKQAYATYLANGRLNLAVTKTRGDVSGGGKKPWKQKGTGRARFGSTRNPIWTGGGVAFGPTGEENYSKQLNTKAKRTALRQALSLASDKVIVIEEVAAKTAKTAELAGLLAKIGVTKKALLVVDTKSDELVRAARNLSNVKLVSATYLNVFDVMNADSIVVSTKALEAINAWLGTSTGSVSKEGTK